jgi:predicted Ser/Thr protein kinase
MYSTPFVVGQWVRGRKFYGRSVLIDEILHGNRNWLWLLGTRRIGKTSLLRQLEHLAVELPESSYIPLYWDLQGSEDLDEFHQGLMEALLDAEERLEPYGIAVKDVEGRDAFDTLGKLRRKVSGAGRRLLLLCDEVEELINLNRQDSSLLRKLRRLLQSKEDIRSVLASTIRLWALSDTRGDTSPFLHGFTPPLYIGGLTDEEARGLIRQANLPSDSRPAFDDETVEQIRSHCDNHPYLIQLVCKRHLEVGGLKEALEQVASDQMVSYFFAVDFEMLSEVERDILQLIAETASAASNTIQGRLGLEQDTLSGFLYRLGNLGFIRRNPKGQFELINYFFRRWFRTYRPGPAAVSGETTLTTGQAAQVGDSSGLFDMRYRILEPIGEGATGVVYKAEDQELRETIALKILKPALCLDSDFLDRFRQEILLGRDIDHPNILRVYHLGDSKGRKYLTMKWIEGKTLGALLKEDGPPEMDWCLEVTRKLASALDAAHRHRVIHRDIKPDNILLDKVGEPFLTDFGLARMLDNPSKTRPGLFMGTPEYASPEQIKLALLDERSDLYALGLVIFEMVTGTKPFPPRTVREILDAHEELQPPDPASRRDGIPEPLRRSILRCLENDPEKRFQSAADLRAALD